MDFKELIIEMLDKLSENEIYILYRLIKRILS